MGHIPEHNCPVTTEPALCCQRRCETDPCVGAKRQNLLFDIRFGQCHDFDKIAHYNGFSTAQAREILSKKDLTAVPGVVE